MPNLTPKQEKFAQGIAKGLTQADAYRQAYDCDASTNDTIANEAYKLTCNPDIATRIVNLNAKIEEKIIYEAIDHFRELEQIKQLALTPSGDKGEIDLNTAGKMVVKKGELMSFYKQGIDLTSGGKPIVQFITKAKE